MITLLVVHYVKPRYESGVVTSLKFISELDGALDAFPSVGEIKYVRRTQAGTLGILFTGKALSDKINEFCEKENCFVYPAKDYQQIWQVRVALYQASQNEFPISFGANDFHFDGPEALRVNPYRITFFYMPDKQVFIGEVFFFR